MGWRSWRARRVLFCRAASNAGRVTTKLQAGVTNRLPTAGYPPVNQEPDVSDRQRNPGSLFCFLEDGSKRKPPYFDVCANAVMSDQGCVRSPSACSSLLSASPSVLPHVCSRYRGPGFAISAAQPRLRYPRANCQPSGAAATAD